MRVLAPLNPEHSMRFVEGFLEADDLSALSNRGLILAENAALAIGESRTEKAFEILRYHREKSVNPEFQDMLLMPMALTRLEGAFDYLIDVIENGNKHSAVSAVDAVKIFGGESHWTRIQDAIEFRYDTAVYEAYAAWQVV